MEIPISYISSVLSRAANYAMSVLGLNIQYGYAGLFNLGIVVFSLIGAYTTAILATKFHADFFTTMLVSIVFAMIAAFLIGIPSLRTRGDYFGIVTLGFAYVAYSLVLNWNAEPIRGALGIPAIKRPVIFGVSFNTFEMLMLLSFAFLIIAFALAGRIANSPYGRLLRAIREDEDAAMSLGKDVTKYKLSAFVAGAVFAAAGGSLYAYWATYIEPRQFGVLESVYVLFAVLIGGKGNLWGSVLGAFIFILLPEPLRFLNLPSHLIGGIRQLMLGALLLFVVLYKPDGLIPERIRHHG